MKTLSGMFEGVHPVGDSSPLRGVVFLAFVTIACSTMHGVAHAQRAAIIDQLEGSRSVRAELIEVEVQQGMDMDYYYSLERDALALRLNRTGIAVDVKELIRRAGNFKVVDDRAIVVDGGEHLYIVQMDESGRLSAIMFPKSNSLCRLIPWICAERPSR